MLACSSKLKAVQIKEEYVMGMDFREATAFMILIIFFTLLLQQTQVTIKVEGRSGLSYDFYQESCPQLEILVRDSLRLLALTDVSTSSALLRLLFHDCQVQGCDASILVDAYYDHKNTGEMGSSKNLGIRKREIIGLIKSTVEAICPRRVSCADILVLAAREAVAISGGPRIRVPLGRRDSTALPSRNLADQSLPPATIGVDATIRFFAAKGMTVEETVAIIGSHTLGVTHCFNVQKRHLSCPLGSLTPNTSFVVNDPTTLIFDNQYYVNSASGRGILRVDSELPLDPRTAPFVARFAVNQYEFFRAYSSAFLKLSSFGVLTGNQGVIRQKCNLLTYIGNTSL